MSYRYSVTMAAGLMALFLCACSDDDKASAGCNDADDCPAYACTCTSGAQATSAACIMQNCASEVDACEVVCSDGVVASGVVPTLAGSAECSAVCGAIRAVDCPHSACVHQYCDISPGSCEAAVRAELQCLAGVTWVCENNFVSPESMMSCYADSSLCAVDAGAD